MYTYTSQQGKQVTIDNIEQAKRVIVATAMVRCHDSVTILGDKDIKSVAETFGISLDDLIIVPSDHPHDFAFNYYFEK